MLKKQCVHSIFCDFFLPFWTLGKQCVHNVFFNYLPFWKLWKTVRTQHFLPFWTVKKCVCTVFFAIFERLKNCVFLSFFCWGKVFTHGWGIVFKFCQYIHPCPPTTGLCAKMPNCIHCPLIRIWSTCCDALILSSIVKYFILLSKWVPYHSFGPFWNSNGGKVHDAFHLIFFHKTVFYSSLTVLFTVNNQFCTQLSVYTHCDLATEAPPVVILILISSFAGSHFQGEQCAARPLKI